MALLDFKFYSDCLGQCVTVNVILPQAPITQIGMESKREDTFKTLYLLHGLSDDHSIWLRRTSIERYAAAYGIAVVMPAVGRSWYTDTVYGEKYFSYITEELPAVCRSYFKGMSAAREDNFVAGLSMGGYGAVKVGLRFPDRYAAVAAFSGAYDVAGRAARSEFGQKGYWESIFGDVSAVAGSDNDVYALAARADGAALPRFYISCGESDRLLDDSRRIRAALVDRGATVAYREAPGNHEWGFWDAEIQRALNFFLEEKSK